MSRASSWDFSVTPSMPSSPARGSVFPSTVRSPNFNGLHDYFANFPSGTHSRSSSHIPSLPPSPRVSLRVWAEKTASSDQLYDPQTARLRTGSETGKGRSTSRVDLRRGQSKSASFNDKGVKLRGSSSDFLGSSDHTRRLPTIGHPVIANEGIQSSRDTAQDRAARPSLSPESPVRPRAKDTISNSPPVSILVQVPPEPCTPIPTSVPVKPELVSPASTQDSGTTTLRLDSPSSNPDVPNRAGNKDQIKSPDVPVPAGKEDKKGWLTRRGSAKRDGKGWGAGLVGALTGKKLGM